MKTSWSIRSLMVVLVAAVTLPLTALAVHHVASEKRWGTRLVERTALDVADIVAAGIGHLLKDAQHTLAELASRPAVRSLDPTACAALLGEAVQVLAPFVNLSVTDPSGRPVCSALPPPRGGTTDLDHATLGPAPVSGRVHSGRPTYGEVSGRWIVVLALPVLSEEGEEVLAHVGASVDLDRFRVLLTSADLPPGGVVTLAHRDGTVVARSADPATWVGRQLPSVEGGAAHAVLGRGIERAPGADGVDRVWGFRRVPDSDWMVYAGVPTSWVEAEVAETVVPSALSGAGIVLLLTVFAGLLYKRINGSLAFLVEGARQAARGANPRIPLEGPPEVMAVAEQFNRALAERDRAVADVRRSRERYRSIVENAVLGIYVSTRDGRILEANPAMARMLGYESPEAMLDVPMQQLYPDEGAREHIIEQATQGRTSGSVETQWVRRDGRPLTVSLRWRSLEVPGVGPAFEVLAEDLTDRKDLEEQLREAHKLEAVGRLAGGVAHDFNNRLTVIQGQAQLLELDLPEDSPLRKNVQAILESSERVATLTRQLLAFGRKQMARPRHLDLNEVVARMADLLPSLLGERVTVETTLASGGAPVRADPGQIEQILLNLCTNARDAMPEGGRLALETSVREVAEPEGERGGPPPGTWVVLSVRDTGSGMDEETRSRIFEPFFTTKPTGTGTGLGLSTVYGLVLQSGGHVDLSTAPGAGTSFDVWLPVASGVADEPGVRTNGRASTDSSGRTVLVAEDEDAVREVMVRALGRAGYEVLAARGGEEALQVEAAHEGAIDLLLTDVVMPGMLGPELARHVSERRPGVKVLFVSGYAERPPVSPEAPTGGQEFLAKPFTPDQLVRSVGTLLAG